MSQRQRSYFGTREPGLVSKRVARRRIVLEDLKSLHVFTDTVTTDVALGGYGFVVVFDANTFANITGTGTHVRVLFEAAAAGALTLDAASISKHPGSGNAWDSDTNLKQLFFGRSASLILAAGETGWSDWLRYDFEPAEKQIIAFDANATNGNIRRINAGFPGDVYQKAATAESLTQSRSAGYTTLASYNYCIKQVEVLELV